MFAYCKNNPVNLSDSTGYHADVLPLNPWAEFFKTVAFVLGTLATSINPFVLFGAVLLSTFILSKPVVLGDGTLTAAQRKSKSTATKPVASDGEAEAEQPTRRESFRKAKEAAGIPRSAQHEKHGKVRDKEYEDRTVFEFKVSGKKKYVVENRNDKNGRGPHFHGATEKKVVHLIRENMIN